MIERERQGRQGRCCGPQDCNYKEDKKKDIFSGNENDDDDALGPGHSMDSPCNQMIWNCCIILQKPHR